MSTLSKIAGLVVGVSTVATLGIAIAQGQPPNPLVSNPAIGAGQQSTHITPMGETGVLTQMNEIRVATITKQQDVAVVTPPAAPAPAPVAQVQESTTVAMGAPQAPAEMPHAAPAPKRDRN